MVQIIAHRGDLESGPENTLSAFVGAYQLGIRLLETDAHLSRDGKVLAFHDDVLDRVSDRRGKLSELSYHEILQARIGERERVPLMEEVLEACPEATLNIDAKSDAVVQPLIELIQRTGSQHRVCLASFSSRRLRQMRAQLPNARSSMGQAEVFRTWLAAKRLSTDHCAATWVQIPPKQWGIPIVSKSFVDYQHQRGREVHVWTINEAAQLPALIEMGVDGVMTDYPRRMLAALSELNLAQKPSP
ncbi:MAG: glycerophosphodiester phosphodiesterase [Gammaproteobacteria bacterium]|nr:glycerophosphodiester phosphodiesterase [Gammaproteobacteria bacterium]